MWWRLSELSGRVIPPDLGHCHRIRKRREKILSRYADHFYAVLRIVVGFLFACHGAQKLFGVLGGPRELSDPEGLSAGIIEFVAGSLIAGPGERDRTP